MAATSGMEMMITSLLAKAGIDVKQVMATVNNACAAVQTVDRRLQALERQNAELRRLMLDMAARLPAAGGSGTGNGLIEYANNGAGADRRGADGAA